MKKILLILPLLYYSCKDHKVNTDEASKSDKMLKLIKDVAKDKLGKSKVDCHKRCKDSFDFLDWNRQTKGEEIDTLFNQCIQECIKGSGNIHTDSTLTNK